LKNAERHGQRRRQASAAPKVRLFSAILTNWL
jgi:hypothetical protein